MGAAGEVVIGQVRDVGPTKLVVEARDGTGTYTVSPTNVREVLRRRGPAIARD